MATPKVQLTKDFGCGLGSFTSPAPVLEGIAVHLEAEGVRLIHVVAEARVVAVVAATSAAARTAQAPAGAVVVESAAALHFIENGSQVRLDVSSRRIEDIGSGRAFACFPK